jgi:hypothetical protein
MKPVEAMVLLMCAVVGVVLLGRSDLREHWIATRRLRLESLEAEGRELIKLRRDHQVNEELMHQIERKLDLEEVRLRA